MPSATLLLPTTAWDTNFVATTMSEEPASGTTGQVPGIDFVAQQDGTQITLLPTTNITALNGVIGATKNTPVVYNLNKGQQLRLMQAIDTSGNDLTGSIVQSNSPIGVWGEHFCMTHSEQPPKWRVVGAVKGTTLTYDPPVTGAPTTLDEGQLVEFDGPGAFDVKAQDNLHPFYLAAHRPASHCDAAPHQLPPSTAHGTEYVAIGNETATTIGGPGDGQTSSSRRPSTSRRTRSSRTPPTATPTSRSCASRRPTTRSRT